MTRSRLLATDYGAQLQPLDFAHDPEGARQTANAWANEATHATIPPLFPPGSIDNSTVLVLANAIYFKSAWVEAFDPEETQDAPFYRADGSSITVPMMHMDTDVAHASGSLADVVELPYRDNCRCCSSCRPRSMAFRVSRLRCRTAGSLAS